MSDSAKEKSLGKTGIAEASKKSYQNYLERDCYLEESPQPNGAKGAQIEGKNVLEILLPHSFLQLCSFSFIGLR